MCGIVGVFGSDLDYKSKDIFKDLLMIDTIRGPDSTGVIAVSNEGDVNTYKKAVDGHTFVQLRGYKNITTGLHRALIGHNRWATVGKVNDETAHPFSHGDTHLVHNGTLKTWYNLHKHTSTSVDSEAIALNVEHEGLYATAGKLNGAFAIASYDAYLGSLSLIRNSERPLCIGKVKGKDLVVIASEMPMIYMAVYRNNLEVEEAVRLEPKTLVKYDLFPAVGKKVFDSFKVTENVPFYTPPKTTVYGGYSANGKKFHNTNKSTSTTGTGSTSTTKGNVAYLPAKTQRDKEVSEFLSSKGLTKGELCLGFVCDKHQFVKSTDDKPYYFMTGLIYTRAHPEGIDAVIFGLDKMPAREVLFQIEGKASKMIGKPDKEGKKPIEFKNHVIVTIRKELSTKEAEKAWDLLEDKGTIAQQEKEDTPEKKFQGPKKGQLYTEREFEQLTKSGCHVCCDPVPCVDHADVYWLSNEKPLCPSCVKNFAPAAKVNNCTIEALIMTGELM